MNQSRRQILQGAAGLLAGLVATKAVETVVSAAVPPPVPALPPATLAAAVPAAEVLQTAAIECNVSAIATNAAHISSDALFADIKPMFGIKHYGKSMLDVEFQAQFYNEYMGEMYARRPLGCGREDYLLQDQSLSFELRLLARSRGNIECELAPGLHINPHAVILDRGGWATVVMPQASPLMFMGYKALRRERAVAATLVLGSPASRKLPDLRVSATLTIGTEGETRLNDTAAQRLLATARQYGYVDVATLPTGNLIHNGYGRRLPGLHLSSQEFVAFQVPLAADGLFGDRSGAFNVPYQQGSHLVVGQDRIFTIESSYLPRPQDLAMKAMTAEIGHLVYDYQKALGCGPIVQGNRMYLWSRPPFTAPVMMGVWAEVPPSGLAEALPQVSAGCHLSDEQSYWDAWDMDRYLAQERPQALVGEPRMPYRDWRASSLKDLAAQYNALPGQYQSSEAAQRASILNNFG